MKYYGLVIDTIFDKKIYPFDVEAEFKPQHEDIGIGCCCKWHKTTEDRDETTKYVIGLGYSLDIEECDKYYGRID